MMNSITDSLVAVRDVVFDNVDAQTRFAFDFFTADDIGTGAGPLFSQDGDFFLFEAEVDETRRAGPGVSSPTRCWGTLAITLHTKDSSKEITHMRQLEDSSRWFAEQTIRGIRFRTFTPLSTARVMGFTAYSGVLNFDFELTPR